LAGKMHRSGAVLSHTARATLYGLTVATLAFACGGTTTEQVIGPTASRCQIATTAPPPAVPASGSQVSLNVTAARDCTWTATSEAPWVTVTPASGQGSALVAIAVAPNALGSSRSSAVAINDTRVAIDQQGVPCRFELGDQSVRVGASGGRAMVRVTTIDGCDWRASSTVDWVRVLNGGGTGSGTVDLDVSANEGGERSTTLSIAGTSFVLVQDSVSGGPGNSPPVNSPPGSSPPPPVACTFSIDPERAAMGAAARQGSVRVITASGCPWTASSGASWISVQRSDGNGPDTVSYQVSANTSTVSERSGSVAVAGRTHRVTQQPCDLSIEGGHPHLPATSGTYSFTVTTSAGCTWTAQSSDSWISVNNSSGTGSGVISYRLDTNIGRGREGSIAVSGRVKSITQYGVLD
jgi:Viral BACON domain/Putative binding domain, N-terminal